MGRSVRLTMAPGPDGGNCPLPGNVPLRRAMTDSATLFAKAYWRSF